MRTTLTLEDDVACRLEVVRVARGMGLKEAVNEVLRAGLDRLEAPAMGRRKRFVQRTYRADPLVPDFDCGPGLLAMAEGEGWR